MNIEKIVMDYLRTKQEIPVFPAYPDNAPDKFIIVEKLGGGCSDYIFDASIAIKSYGPTKYDTSEINEAVKPIMLDITELPAISGCSLDADYPFNDTQHKRHRYQAVFNINHY